jgi:hypothetical protein
VAEAGAARRRGNPERASRSCHVSEILAVITPCDLGGKPSSFSTIFINEYTIFVRSFVYTISTAPMIEREGERESGRERERERGRGKEKEKEKERLLWGIEGGVRRDFGLETITSRPGAPSKKGVPAMSPTRCKPLW